MLIRRLKEERFSVDVTCCVSEEVVIYEDAIKIIYELAGEYNNGWIPCSERLPEQHDSMFKKFKGTVRWDDAMFEEISDRVLVTGVYREGTPIVFETSLYDGQWKDAERKGIKVVAWMPLPEAYKDGGE